MYFLPGYVTHYEKDSAIFVSSQLHQNLVKLSDPTVMEEFRVIIKNNGCPDISTELGRFLHGQKLLINHHEFCEEIQGLREMMNQSLHITMMPTEGCNFRCPYCYEDHAPNTMRRQVLDRIQEYITQQALKFERIHISWFGGEPTLCKDTVLETALLLQNLQKNHGFQYTSSMTTNGYLLNKSDLLLYFNAGITTFQITLDGWNHDKTRPHVSGKGTLQMILDNLRDISTLPAEEYQFEIVLRYNILPDSECESWYDHLYALFGHDKRFSVLVQSVGNLGGETVYALELLEGENRESMVRRHVDYLKKIGMPCRNERKSVFAKICYASYPHSMVFRANGTIEKCTVALNHPKNCIGHVEPELGVMLDEEANRLWYETALKSDCCSCVDVLSCLNKQCPKSRIINGIECCNGPNTAKEEVAYAILS